MKYLSGLLLLLLPLIGQAMFSAFAPVNPETVSEYDFGIKVSVAESTVCTVRIDPVGYPGKQAWLVISTGELSPKEQELRTWLWKDSELPRRVTLISKISPVGDGMDAVTDKSPGKSYYEVTLQMQRGYNSYVYIDFPHMVLDGGYYYSIDLNAFCGW